VVLPVVRSYWRVGIRVLNFELAMINSTSKKD